jgi:hypothetical protein
MPDIFLVVERLVIAGSADHFDLCEHAWEIALDQRVFGPRRLIVAMADAAGNLREVLHTERTDPPELAFALCLEQAGRGLTAALALCDEPVALGPPPDDLASRFATARAAALIHGVLLLDWIACDDQVLRSARLALDPDAGRPGGPTTSG